MQYLCEKCKKKVNPIYLEEDKTYLCEKCIDPARKMNINLGISELASWKRQKRKEDEIKGNQSPRF